MTLLPQLPNIAIYHVGNGWIVKIIRNIRVINPMEQMQRDPLLDKLQGKSLTGEFPLKDESCYVFDDFTKVLNFLQIEIIKHTNV